MQAGDFSAIKKQPYEIFEFSNKWQRVGLDHIFCILL